MSTWNTLTIARTDRTPLDVNNLDALRGLLAKREHDYESAVDGYEGDPFDFGHQWDESVRRMVPDRTEARASWHSKYHDGDLPALAATLGEGWTVSHYEEWTDDDPGASTTTYVDGQLDNRASSSLRTVPDVLAHIDFTDPESVAAILAALPAPPAPAS